MILAYHDVRIDAPGRHSLPRASKDPVLAALYELKPPLVVLGADVGALSDAERRRLMRRIGFVPANGGLLSNLNGWENISLPVGYHAPQKLEGAFADARALLAELDGVDGELLAKLPDDMTPYERRVAAYIRALLEAPDLLVVEERANRFAEVYRARHPGGTYLEFEQ